MNLPVVRKALLPASSVYGAFAAARRRAYQRGWLASQDVGVPVVSVGGLSVGGSGKTPIAGHVAAWLMGRIAPVGVVCAGYRGRAGARVLQVRSSGDGAGAWYGDEPVMLARHSPDAIVVRGSDKVAAAQLATRLGARIVVVDDGFQHLKLRRALDIVVCGSGDGLALPAGPGHAAAKSRGKGGRAFHLPSLGADQRSEDALRAKELVAGHLSGAFGRIVPGVRGRGGIFRFRVHFRSRVQGLCRRSADARPLPGRRARRRHHPAG